MSRLGVFTHVRTLEPAVIADLDTLLVALYVELTDAIIPSLGPRRRGPGRPPAVTDAELVCLAVAQVLLRYDDERHWLRAAPHRVGHLFPRLLGQSEYNQRLKHLAPLMEAALRWLAEHTPTSAELLRLMDATPVPCGQSVITARRSDLAGWAGYGYCPSHSRWYWGAKLLLIVTCEGTITGFGLANPKLLGERQQARQLLADHPANRPAPGTAIVTDKGLAGADTEAFFASPGLELTLLRPARNDETAPGTSPTGCGSASRRSSGRSSTSSAWNATAAVSPPGCGPGSSSGSWRSTPPSGTTGTSARRSSVP